MFCKTGVVFKRMSVQSGMFFVIFDDGHHQAVVSMLANALKRGREGGDCVKRRFPLPGFWIKGGLELVIFFVNARVGSIVVNDCDSIGEELRRRQASCGQCQPLCVSW